MKQFKYLLLICVLATSLAGCSNSAESHTDEVIGNDNVATENDAEVYEDAEETENEEAFTEDEEEETEADYTEEAEYILTQVDIFFEALSTGDIDTLVSMCDEEQEYYEYLTAMSEYDFTPQFLQTLYGDTRYYIEEDAKEELMDDLASFHEDGDDDYISIEVVYSYRYMFLMGEVYPAAFEDGTLIEEYARYDSNEEALADLATAVPLIPCVSNKDFEIKIKEDGKIVIALDDVIGNMEIEEVGDINEKYPMHYAEEFLEVSTFDAIVGETGNGFYENNETLLEIDRLLAAKDYVGLETYLGSVTGVDYKTKYGNDYGTYEELTDSQKAFVDEFITNGFDYQLIGLLNADPDSPMYNYRTASFMLTSPKVEITDSAVSQWYWENDIKDITISYSVSTDLPLYDEFIYRYYMVIAYAKEHIE